MTPTKSKDLSATLAEQMEEFERLNGKVKTTPIQDRSKNKASFNIQISMEVKRSKGNKKSTLATKQRI